MRQRGASTRKDDGAGGKLNNKKKVVIVGGGPAGAATAKGLADQHQLYDVELFEAYPHPDQIEENAPKAYVIALGPRGQRGIQDSANIHPSDVRKAIVSTTMVRHPSLKQMKHDQNPSLIVPRKDLTAYLLDQAQAAGAKIHFQHRLVNIDFEKRVAIFEDSSTTSSKTTISVSYELLIAADGSKSHVRTLLDEKQAEDFSVVRIEEDSMEYQVVTLPSKIFPADLPDSAAHAWNNKKYNSICLAFPLHSGGTLFAIVFPEGNLEEFQTKHAATKDGYDDALNCLLPDIPDEAMSEIIDQLSVGKPANGGLCVWTSSLGSAKHGVVLVGDSGHGMWPSLGQGCNCALESVAVFCQSVNHVEDSLEKGRDLWSKAVVEEFNAQRHEDALAAVDLTYGGIGARKSRGRGNAPLSYKLQIAGIMLLNKISFGVVPKPALSRLMKGEELAYKTAHKYNFFYEKVICLGALVVFVGVPILSRYHR